MEIGTYENIQIFSHPILDECDRVFCEEKNPTVYVDGAAWCEECAKTYIDDFWGRVVDKRETTA